MAWYDSKDGPYTHRVENSDGHDLESAFPVQHENIGLLDLCKLHAFGLTDSKEHQDRTEVELEGCAQEDSYEDWDECLETKEIKKNQSSRNMGKMIKKK